MNSTAKFYLTSGLLMCVLAASPVNGEDDAEAEKVIVDEARTLLNWRTNSIRFFVCQYDLSNVDSLSSVLSNDAGTEIKRLLRLASSEDSSDLPGRRTLPPRVDGFDEVKDALKNCSTQSVGSLPTSLHKEIKDQYDKLIRELPASQKSSMNGVKLSFEEVGVAITVVDLNKKTVYIINTNSYCRAHLHQRLFLRIELSSEGK
ncbi:MAG: hypothetical protein E8D40_13300 [Nitrospira sp.]|nr:MAG: hypothetical protein E8D40_13300 [Nitrospira sp.]